MQVTKRHKLGVFSNTEPHNAPTWTTGFLGCRYQPNDSPAAVHTQITDAALYCFTSPFTQMWHYHNAVEYSHHHSASLTAAAASKYIHSIHWLPLNLGYNRISFFPANLTLDKTLLMQFCYLSRKNRHFWGYKCVSIQNTTWILLRSPLRCCIVF